MGLTPLFAPSPVKGTPREPPNDALIAPDLPPLKALAPEAFAPRAPGFYQTSEFMIGRVAVGIVTPESNGAIDSSTENWDTTRQTQVVAEIQAALQWWRDNANAPSNLTFVYDIHHSVATSYEPIARSAFPDTSGQGLWIGEVMTNLGYSGSSYFAQVRDYLNALRQTHGTNWVYAIFVVDSLNDSDGQFADGKFAYAYINGPFIVMTYDNDGWGIDRMDMVTAHETGHTFGALDEYASSGCTDDQRSGYLDIANTNCENGDPPTEDSIMRSAESQEIAWPNHLVSTPARQMVGWRDSDGDGKELYDPMDTTPTVTLTPYSPDPTTDTTPTYSGSSQDTPYPSPTHTPTTINTVRVEWRVDGGPWQNATPSDGAFDSDTESFTFTSTPLASDTHVFEVRAINSVGNISALDQDTLTISGESCDTTQVGSNQLVGCVYDNTDLSGSPQTTAPSGPTLSSPVLSSATALTFDWGFGGPSGTAPDTFSIRWKGNFTFDAGTYTFTAGADDGVRVKIDGNTQIEDWGDHGYRERSKAVTLSGGTHLMIEVEYYENGGAARVEVRWSGVEITAPTVSPFCSGSQSKATISWDVGDGSLGYYIDISPDSSFSSFWNKYVPSGTTTTEAPDGFEPFWGVSGDLVLSGGTTYWVRVWYPALGQHSPTASFTAASNCGGCDTTQVGSNQLIGCVYDNTDLSGSPQTTAPSGPTLSSPVLSSATALAFDWGFGGPSGTGPDTFSVRWKGNFNFNAGTYTFTVGADDGVRLKIDGTTRIDDWSDHPYREKLQSVDLSGGTHLVEVEYYENGGAARVEVRWAQDGGDGADLVVTALSGPTTGTIGGQITVSTTLRNQGTGDAGAFRLGFYWSTDSTITTGDTFSGWTCTYSSGLSAGATATCNGTVGVPSSLTPGWWYLGAIVDDQGAVDEGDNEGNNARAADTGPIWLSGSCATTSISPGTFVSGTLTTSDCIAPDRPGSYADLYRFTGTAGQTAVVALNSTAFDTYVFLLDSSMAKLAENDDAGGSTNSQLQITLPYTGTYFIEATSYSAGATGGYDVAVFLYGP